MSTATEESKERPAVAWGYLPPQMRILFVSGTGRTGSWLADAFASDSASEIHMEGAVGVAAGLARLRDEIFDAVLIGHEGEELDALELLDAIRTGSSEEQPVIVLGQQSEEEMSALCYEARADAYVCVNSTTTRTLIWKVARAIERHQLIAENRRLEQSQQHRLQLEHDEATRLLEQQRHLISDLGQIRSDPSNAAQEAQSEWQTTSSACEELPQSLVDHYRELLRAYVIMGSGNLTGDMQRLAEMLATAGVTASQAMLLHLHVLEEMVHSLGSRSARHVMNRADLLILEMIINLSEGYRRRLSDYLHPPVQMLLPGFQRAA